MPYLYAISTGQQKGEFSSAQMKKTMLKLVELDLNHIYSLTRNMIL